MLTVYLLRHGETVWNADGNRYCGATDVELTAKGLQQAQLAATALAGLSFDAVYSSPLQRAFQTARIASGGTNVIVDQRLIEADFGQWEGKTKEEFIAENADLWKDWCQAPGHTRAGGTGETAKQVIDRVDDFFWDMMKKHPDGTLLVIAHNAVNRFYMAWKLGMPLKKYRQLVQENSAITRFSLDETGAFSLLNLNCR